jgi:type IV pilus assembly protein PilZ
VTYAQKRQYERYAVALDVAFNVGSERVAARSKDVSLGGMFIVTDRALPYGTKFELEVRLPALTQPALIEATVRWSGPNGMGVQWGLLRARETWAIHQLTKR